jgi:hypothetical protein
VLLLSLMTLFAGPLMFQWLSRSHRVARILDRVIVVALIGLVALSLVPEIVASLAGRRRADTWPVTCCPACWESSSSKPPRRCTW